MKRSATESLAARYRHLFVLPRTSVLLALSVLASLLLGLVARPGDPLIGFFAVVVVFLLSALVLTSSLALKDAETIATFRRVTAVLFANQIVWLVLAVVGAACSLASGTDLPLINSVVFAGFACIGLEFLVIRGAFTRSTPLSAFLAVVHPLGTFMVIGSPIPPVPLELLPGVAGVAVMAVIVAFPVALSRRKTSQGHSVVALFQAFMKTWTSRRAEELERIIQDHAEEAKVTTKVMRFRKADGDLFVVMPGVHPGPFFPVGSYNFPGLVSREFKGLGPVLVLHRPGGHERNLASNDRASSYAAAVRDFAAKVEATRPGTVRGPAGARIGKAAVSATAFEKDLLLTISFAPLGSDDLEPRVEEEISRTAAEAGFDASVVDAHNSISHGRETPDTSDPAWKELFASVGRAEARPLRIAYAHSSETSFSPGADITENGVGLLMIEAGGLKSVLVLADANNAVPALHDEASKALEAEGYRLIEFCTSDSHDLAARGLTVARGYEALGEDTPMGSIRALVVGLAKAAEPRLAPCKYGSGSLTRTVNVFGAEALEEFASVAQASSSFARRYSKLAAACAAILFVLSLAA